jgi:hypothetical protein
VSTQNPAFHVGILRQLAHCVDPEVCPERSGDNCDVATTPHLMPTVKQCRSFVCDSE